MLSETAVTEYVVTGGALMFSGQHITFWNSSSRFKPCYGIVSLERRCINGYWWCATGVKPSVDHHPIQGGVAILLTTLYNRNWYKLWPDELFDLYSA